MGTIEQGVRQAVENCLKVKPGERALVITDARTIEIGSALKAAIERIAGEVQFFVMEDFGQRPIDFPQAIQSAIRLADSLDECSFACLNSSAASLYLVGLLSASARVIFCHAWHR